MATFKATKAPGARLPFEIDWSAYLADDAIVTSTWAIEGDDASLVVDEQTYDSNIARAWVTGGTTNRRYHLVNTVTTDGGTVDVRTIEIDVANL